jgi:hypothetical protein
MEVKSLKFDKLSRLQRMKRPFRMPYAYNTNSEKIIVSLRTAQAKEYSIDKEQTSYDDLVDALRLSFKVYNIE